MRARRHLVLSRHARAAAGPAARDVCDLRVLPHGGRHRRRRGGPLAERCRRWPPGARAIAGAVPRRDRRAGDARAGRARSRRFALRQEDFLAVIDGMQMDAETPIVAPDLATLDLYCDRVAVGGRPAVGARVRRCLAGRGPGGARARPRAAAHQHPARRAGGCGARPAVSAARVSRRGRRAARSAGGAARTRACREVCARVARAGARAVPRTRGARCGAATGARCGRRG